MGLITAIISAISQRLGDLLRAILGWSVTALFGRLGTSRQTALTVLVVASVLWPMLVIGIFFPKVATWLIAFVPLHNELSANILRILWLVLSIAVPPIVGLGTSLIIPAQTAKRGALRMLLHGYLLTIGYAASFLLTAVVVAVVKLRTMARRWTEEHVLVQPAEGEYGRVLEQVRGACERAGLEVFVEPVPSLMSLPTRILAVLAEGAVDALVTKEPHRLRSLELEAYLYPADLLLRGTKRAVARVRAELTTAELERYAYLVGDEEAQHIQTELRRFWEVIARHRSVRELGAVARSRLDDICEELKTADIPFEDWVILDRIRHRLSDAVRGAPSETAIVRSSEEEIMRETMPEADGSTMELIKQVVDDARALMKVEVALAKAEMQKEIADAKKAGIAFGIALALALVGLSTLCTALVIAAGDTALSALIIGLAVLALAGIAAFIAYRKAPTKPMLETRRRLEENAHQLKERIA